MFDTTRDLISFFERRKAMEFHPYDKAITVEMAYDRWLRGGNEKFYLTELQKRGRFDLFERFRFLFERTLDTYSIT